MRTVLVSMMLSLTVFSLLLFTQGCDPGAEGGDPAGPPTVTFEATPTGRVFRGTGPFEGLEIVVPADAVDESVELTVVQEEGNPLPAGGASVGPQFNIGPAELALSKPITVRVPFDPSVVVNLGADVRAVKVWAVLPEAGWSLLDAEMIEGDRVEIELGRPTLLGAGVDLGESAQ
jgi:hypothetical protein